VKVVLFILIAFFALAAVVTLGGALLPRQHVASRRARFRAPADTLWRTLTDFARLPDWAPEMVRVERMEDIDGHPVWLHIGRRWRAPMEVMEFVPPRRLVLRIADPKLPFAGTWTYEVAEAPDGTTVTITENGEIGNPAMRFLSRFVFGQTSTMDAYLKALGRRHGETVTPMAGVAAGRS
jgi:uncharacterized protein YndB with AHSA1/START domain